MIDSHAHIAEPAYDDDRNEVLQRAAAAGVEAILVIGYDAASSRRVIELVRAWGGSAGPPGAARAPTGEGTPAAGAGVALYATAGVAPHHVMESGEDDLAAVRDMLDDPAVVAVGEIGLDYHYDMPRQEQRALYDRQLGWARERDLPVVIHSREAEDDVLAGLRAHGCRRGVIHCFTESARMAEAAVELGLYVSFAGILTFKNAQELRDVAARLPLERILVETDSPYLAPVPHRGRRNEPAWVLDVARAIAELHGVDLAEVERVTTRNVRTLFRLP